MTKLNCVIIGLPETLPVEVRVAGGLHTREREGLRLRFRDGGNGHGAS